MEKGDLKRTITEDTPVDDKSVKDGESFGDFDARQQDQEVLPVEHTEETEGNAKPIALDDTRRVKIISPGVLVAKRFFRNKLAIIGLVILIFMFAFCFLGGWLSPYDEAQVFHTRDFVLFDYGEAKVISSSIPYYLIEKRSIDMSLSSKVVTYIKEMESINATTRKVFDSTEERNEYRIDKRSNEIYAFSTEVKENIATYMDKIKVASYNYLKKDLILEDDTAITNKNQFSQTIRNSITNTSYQFTYSGANYHVEDAGARVYIIYEDLDLGIIEYVDEEFNADFENQLRANLDTKAFTYSGRNFVLLEKETGFLVKESLGIKDVIYATKLIFHRYNVEENISDELKNETLKALAYGTTAFDLAGKSYQIIIHEGSPLLRDITEESNIKNVALITDFSAARYDGKDTMSIEFKKSFREKVESMLESGDSQSTFIHYTKLIDEQGEPLLDEDGNEVFGEAEFRIMRQLDNFKLKNYQEKDLINMFEPPSKKHTLGTDGNGMDVLTRVMYGGRISLMVGFIVIFLSMLIGVILGGIAGFFGKWVDNLIMRIVDIFYCIPTMPILIITGAVFDAMQLTPYVRIMYLMIMLGVLGWSGIARLVRGQILSLREQEFMIAAEATGLKASRRIFRHLVPNVMPQLIVNATMGLGGIIITESTLSFLGLGAKYPLATWGAMINSVSNINAMVDYTYIWIPVGVLICLTVIAFNFVGDGLRDAFDPKMKR